MRSSWSMTAPTHEPMLAGEAQSLAPPPSERNQENLECKSATRRFPLRFVPGECRTEGPPRSLGSSLLEVRQGPRWELVLTLRSPVRRPFPSLSPSWPPWPTPSKGAPDGGYPLVQVDGAVPPISSWSLWGGGNGSRSLPAREGAVKVGRQRFPEGPRRVGQNLSGRVLFLLAWRAYPRVRLRPFRGVPLAAPGLTAGEPPTAAQSWSVPRWQVSSSLRAWTAPFLGLVVPFQGGWTKSLVRWRNKTSFNVAKRKSHSTIKASLAKSFEVEERILSGRSRRDASILATRSSPSRCA